MTRSTTLLSPFVLSVQEDKDRKCKREVFHQIFSIVSISTILSFFVFIKFRIIGLFVCLLDVYDLTPLLDKQSRNPDSDGLFYILYCPLQNSKLKAFVFTMKYIYRNIVIQNRVFSIPTLLILTRGAKEYYTFSYLVKMYHIGQTWDSGYPDSHTETVTIERSVQDQLKRSTRTWYGSKSQRLIFVRIRILRSPVHRLERRGTLVNPQFVHN